MAELPRLDVLLITKHLVSIAQVSYYLTCSTGEVASTCCFCVITLSGTSPALAL